MNEEKDEIVNYGSNGSKEVLSTRSKKRITPYLVLASVVCFAGSSLQFGYNLAVINAPELIIRDFFKDISHFKTFWWPFAVSIFAVGGMIGSFVGPFVAKSVGRKPALLLNNILAISGGILLACTKAADSLTVLIIARILLGLNAGVNTAVPPMYLSEIAPVNLRGSLGTLSQFGIVTGILIANIMGLPELLGNSFGWPYMFGITALIGALQLVFLPFCPESPRYLIAIKNDEITATRNLKKLRGTDDVSEEINEIKIEASRESSLEKVSVIDLFKDSSYHKPLLISVVLQLAQQLSGIGGILYYSTTLFEDIGVGQYSQAATCGVGVLSVLMTALVIVLVEVKGRRFLMLLGLGLMAVLYVFVTISFYFYYKEQAGWAKYAGVVTTLLAVAAFQSGPGAIPWFIVAELFTQSSISAATSIAGPANWLGNFAVGLVFPVMKDSINPYTFLPFMALLVIFFLFTYFFVPETKGLTVSEITAKLRGKTNADVNQLEESQGYNSTD